MQFDPYAAGHNPFAVLTAIVAPAILTNACSVLSLGTANRLARVVDRTRIVAAEIKSHAHNESDHQGWVEQLSHLQHRAQLLLSALQSFYAALGAFAAAALISVLGGLAAFYQQRELFRFAAIAAVAIGTFAVVALVRGSVVVVRETRIAVRNLAEEAKLRSLHQQVSQPPEN
jgi:Ni/Fe-hydrogenase subunit HybB-like protein